MFLGEERLGEVILLAREESEEASEVRSFGKYLTWPFCWFLLII